VKTSSFYTFLKFHFIATLFSLANKRVGDGVALSDGVAELYSWIIDNI